MADKFTAAELAELARVYSDLIAAQQLLTRAGIAKADHPQGFRTMAQFWQMVVESLPDWPDGTALRILTGAATAYKTNQVFHRGRVQEVPSAVTATRRQAPPVPDGWFPKTQPPPAEGITREDVTWLAGVVPSERVARQLIADAGLGHSRQPAFTGSMDAELFWYEVARLFNGGAVATVGGESGPARLLRLAGERFVRPEAGR